MDAKDLIEERVAMGFWSRDEVLRQVDDLGDDVDAATIERLFDEALGARHAAAASWSRPRDVERLSSVFEALRAERVIAIENAGWTSQDGMDAIDEVIAAVPDKLVGYVFFHEQDVGRCLASGTLTIAFGAFRETEVTASSGRNKAAMGAYVADQLRRAGFAVEWNGDPGTKLSIVDFIWDRLPDDPPWGIHACIAALRRHG